ncbi:MAG TPA: fumarylacetoacetate hydrolase family protein [Ktedonobacteraceae bacterium]|nr:fumarylacetoacetate hydrolase family protein [Ktedonobacteraceae bacterium]
MKLASFSTTALPKVRIGIVQDNEIIDVDLAARALNIIPHEQMLDLLDHYGQGMHELNAILDKAGGRCFSEVKTFAEIGAVHILSDVQLAAPIPRPRKNLMCLGWNYVEHAKETAFIRGQEAKGPEYPVIFTKAPTTVNSPYGNIIIDSHVSVEIDWEVELAVIIGKGGKNISEDDASSHVFGYTVLNDVTARDLQSRHKQFFKGKSIDGYCPMGPWIVTADEIEDPQNLEVKLRVNGITKQEGNTSMMIFPIRTIIATLSLGMTLEPGDIIATGTPSGVGFTRNPPEFLKAGDVMETEIEDIGTLRNVVVNA